MGSCCASNKTPSEYSSDIGKLMTQNILLLRGLMLLLVEQGKPASVIRLLAVNERMDKYYHSLDTQRTDSFENESFMTTIEYDQFKNTLDMELSQLSSTRDSLTKIYKKNQPRKSCFKSLQLKEDMEILENIPWNRNKLQELEREYRRASNERINLYDVERKVNEGREITDDEEDCLLAICDCTISLIDYPRTVIKYSMRSMLRTATMRIPLREDEMPSTPRNRSSLVETSKSTGRD